MYLFFFCFVFFSKWVFLSRTFTNHRTAGEGEGVSLTPHYNFHRFTDTQTLAERLLQRVHLCIQLAAGLEPGTFSFRAQVLNQMYLSCWFSLTQKQQHFATYIFQIFRDQGNFQNQKVILKCLKNLDKKVKISVDVYTKITL